MKCYESTTANVTGTVTVNAGATLGFKADNTMGHPGVSLSPSCTSGLTSAASDARILQYFDVYLSAANPANLESAGSGATWFKIWDWAPTWTATTGLTFASENIQQFTFTLPASLPSGKLLLLTREPASGYQLSRNCTAGQYLVRGEQIALHVAETFGGAQVILVAATVGCTYSNEVAFSVLHCLWSNQRRRWRQR